MSESNQSMMPVWTESWDSDNQKCYLNEATGELRREAPTHAATISPFKALSNAADATVVGNSENGSMDGHRMIYDVRTTPARLKSSTLGFWKEAYSPEIHTPEPSRDSLRLGRVGSMDNESSTNFLTPRSDSKGCSLTSEEYLFELSPNASIRTAITRQSCYDLEDYSQVIETASESVDQHQQSYLGPTQNDNRDKSKREKPSQRQDALDLSLDQHDVASGKYDRYQCIDVPLSYMEESQIHEDGSAFECEENERRESCASADIETDEKYWDPSDSWIPTQLHAIQRQYCARKFPQKQLQQVSTHHQQSQASPDLSHRRIAASPVQRPLISAFESIASTFSNANESNSIRRHTSEIYDSCRSEKEHASATRGPPLHPPSQVSNCHTHSQLQDVLSNVDDHRDHPVQPHALNQTPVVVTNSRSFPKSPTISSECRELESAHPRNAQLSHIHVDLNDENLLEASNSFEYSSSSRVQHVDTNASHTRARSCDIGPSVAPSRSPTYDNPLPVQQILHERSASHATGMLLVSDISTQQQWRGHSRTQICTDTQKRASPTSSASLHQQQQRPELFVHMSSTESQLGSSCTDDRTIAASVDARAPPLKALTMPARLQVIHEMVETEISYVGNMKVLLDVFVEPMSRSIITADLMQDARVAVFFSNIEQVVALNERLLKDLESRMKMFDMYWSLVLQANDGHGCSREAHDSFEELTFGDLFVEYAPLLRMYGQYAKNYGMACSVLRPFLSRNEGAADLIRAAERSPRCGKQKFFSFLIMPIQRVPRYSLLLRELLKHTDKGHRDAGLLQNALKDVSSSAEFINQAIKERETREEMMKLVGTFGDSMLGAHKLLKTGVLRKLNRKGKESMYTFMLFADQLCYGDCVVFNKGRGRNRISRVIELESCTVKRDVFELQKRGIHGFVLQSPVKSFMAYGLTRQDSNEWFEAISKAIEARKALITSEQAQHAANHGGDGTVHDELAHNEVDSETKQLSMVVAAPLFAQSQYCGVCGSKFGFFLRKHHCMICGRSVCTKCSGGRELLQHIDARRAARLCDFCHDERLSTVNGGSGSGQQSILGSGRRKRVEDRQLSRASKFGTLGRRRRDKKAAREARRSDATSTHLTRSAFEIAEPTRTVAPPTRERRYGSVGEPSRKQPQKQSRADNAFTRHKGTVKMTKNRFAVAMKELMAVTAEIQRSSRKQPQLQSSSSNNSSLEEAAEEVFERHSDKREMRPPPTIEIPNDGDAAAAAAAAEDQHEANKRKLSVRSVLLGDNRMRELMAWSRRRNKYAKAAGPERALQNGRTPTLGFDDNVSNRQDLLLELKASFTSRQVAEEVSKSALVPITILSSPSAEAAKPHTPLEVAKKLLDLEERYLATLDELFDTFVSPLMQSVVSSEVASSAALPSVSSSVAVLFDCVEHIRTVNAQIRDTFRFLIQKHEPASGPHVDLDAAATAAADGGGEAEAESDDDALSMALGEAIYRFAELARKFYVMYAKYHGEAIMDLDKTSPDRLKDCVRQSGKCSSADTSPLMMLRKLMLAPLTKFPDYLKHIELLKQLQRRGMGVDDRKMPLPQQTQTDSVDEDLAALMPRKAQHIESRVSDAMTSTASPPAALAHRGTYSKPIPLSLSSVLSNAKSIVSDVWMLLNNILEKRACFETLKHLETLFVGNIRLAIPARVFVRWGMLDKFDRHGKLEKLAFHLFSDALFYSERTDTAFKLRRRIELKNCELVREGRNKKSKYRYAFQVRANEKSLVIGAASDAEKADWIMSINDCIAQLQISMSQRQYVIGGRGGARQARVATQTTNDDAQSEAVGVGNIDDEEREHVVGTLEARASVPTQSYLNANEDDDAATAAANLHQHEEDYRIASIDTNKEANRSKEEAMWTRYLTDAGHEYFHDAATGRSTWTKPKTCTDSF